VTRRKDSPAKPWAKAKASARVLSPNEEWARQLDERILGDCHPWQLDAVTDPSSRISLLIGRGGAKTTTMRARGLRKTARIQRGIVVYCATSRAQAEELMWFKLKDTCEAYGVMDDYSFLDGKLRMTCNRTGATYRLFGIEDKRDAEKLRGQPFDEVQLDECGSWDGQLLEHVIDRVVAPRLGERKGALVIGGTPPPFQRGPFYDATRLGSDQHRPYSLRDRADFANWIRWSSHAWSLEDVFKLPDSRRRYPALVANWEEALIQKQRRGWADDNPIWMREHLGLWSADQTDRVFGSYRPHVDGKEWNQWDPLNGRTLEGLPALQAAIAALPQDVGTWHYVWVIDSGGTRDPYAINCFAFAPADKLRRIFHVFSLERMSLYGRTIAEMLIGPDLNATRPGGLFGVTGWPDAMEMDGEQSLLDELGNVYGIRCKKAEKKADYKYGAIELVNGDFVEGRIKIMKGSPLEQQIQQLQWKPDEYGMLREDKAQANHSTDCLVYGRRALANLFESGTVADEAPVRQVIDPALTHPHRDADPDESSYDSLLAEPSYDNDAFDSL
jgi:hypothetical protein